MMDTSQRSSVAAPTCLSEGLSWLWRSSSRRGLAEDDLLGRTPSDERSISRLTLIHKPTSRLATLSGTPSLT
jgi:hypothetical protein